MNNRSIRTVVAIGVGAALFWIIGYFIKLPIPFVPNTYVQLQYGVQALFALLFGPVAGFLIGFIGHTFIDLMSGQVWWFWVLASALFGGAIGFLHKRIRLEEGVFGGREIALFNIVQALAVILFMGVLAPAGDVISTQEPLNKVIVQGIGSSFVNIISIAIVGTLLIKVYASTRVKAGSLSQED